MENTFMQNMTVSSFDDMISTITDKKLKSDLYEVGIKLFPFQLHILLDSLDYISPSRKEEVLKHILRFPSLSETQSTRVWNELLPLIKPDKYIQYDKNLAHKIQPSKGLITFSITTCKRLHLFKQTMNSFLRCCTDLSLIGKWICVDDNSTEDDRKSMRELYPFFTFVNKHENDKGHARSMNIILRNVDTPYLFHMEDDWKFFIEDNYLTKCLDIINSKTDYSQCLINRNYTELPIDRVFGGIFNTTCFGNRFFEHEHCPTPESVHAFELKYGKVPHCNYWPGYSLRPSLLRVSSLKTIGSYNENVAHFEMEYAHRYNALKYKSVFMEGMYSYHIGRLTRDRFDETKDNAYKLNGTLQFNLTPTIYSYDTHIVNLDRRPDRMETFKINAPTGLTYTRFSAVDGKKLKSTPQLQRIFNGNDYNMKVGMVGCAMSHIKLYVDIVNGVYKNDIHLILEDDVTFTSNFMTKLHHLLSELRKVNWDLAYVGHTSRMNYITTNTFANGLPEIEKWSTMKSLTQSAGGTIGYLITTDGCKKLLEFIIHNSMTNCIDTIQQKAADTLNVYYVEPHLIKSDCVLSNTATDTDIQYDHSSLSLTTEQRLSDELKEYPMCEQTESLTTLDSKLQYYYVLKPNEKMSDVVCETPYYTIDNKIVMIGIDKSNMLKVNGQYNIDLCLN